ncbi:hypothetical protein QA641_06655 [Bradyrhizobium sp. CB1650]|uniref:hypothetical protein n=1 Tax=Bradyrhizobium sp. CB1650 TaxID=3039153 RepID=UPI0024357119|nr:hypothetical protein [Bradyrhizobium sp. CB1650]WGD53585.1 hypothetical protein QA641_06655 [Bradyrhizobium sp. CB1650]
METVAVIVAIPWVVLERTLAPLASLPDQVGEESMHRLGGLLRKGAGDHGAIHETQQERQGSLHFKLCSFFRTRRLVPPHGDSRTRRNQAIALTLLE